MTTSTDSPQPSRDDNSNLDNIPDVPATSGAPREELAKEARFTESMVLFNRYKGEKDEQALNELFARYQGRLSRRISIMMSDRVRAKVEPEDIAQSVLIHGYRGMDKFEFREPASLLAWLSKIALHRIYAHSRKLATQREMPFGLELHDHDGDERCVEDPQVGMERQELKLLTDQAITCLSEDHRTVLMLRDYDAGSWQHVADEMGRSVGAVQELHTRAVKALGAELGRRGVR